MGAGAFPAGRGLAGLDPVAAPSPAPGRTPAPSALYYDPATRAFAVDTDGNPVGGMLPVDQAVALALAVPLGAIASVPDQGIGLLAAVNAVAPARRAAVATNVVRDHLSSLIRAGAVELLGVEVQAQPPARLMLAVTYRRLQVPSAPPTTLTTPVS